jgi:hypothetical protein
MLYEVARLAVPVLCALLCIVQGGACAQAQENLLSDNLDPLPPSRSLVPGESNLQSPHWAYNVWDESSKGVLVVGDTPEVGGKSLGLVNLGPQAALQLYTPDKEIAAGNYLLSFDMFAREGAQPLIKINLSAPAAWGEYSNAVADGPVQNDGKTKLLLGKATGVNWKPFQLAFSLAEAAKISINMQNGGIGENKGFYFKNLRLVGNAATPVSETGGTVFPQPGAVVDERNVQTTLYVMQGNAGASDSNDGSPAKPFKTISAAIRQAEKLLAQGQGVRVKIGPGTYRESAGHIRTEGAAKSALLVIEGSPDGKTVWSGSEVWPATKWKDLGNGLYAADWPYDWGNWSYQWETPRVLGHRAEMVFAEGQLLRQVLLEEYDYSRTGELIDHGNRKQSWNYRAFRQPQEALQPGSFGVAERDENGNKLYVRLPRGKSISDVRIEVATQRQAFRIGNTDLSEGKDGLVLRDLTIRGFASRTKDNQMENTVAFGGNTRNVLVERCRFEWNNGSGLPIGGQFITIRNSAFNYNGFGGIMGGASHSVLENNSTNFNNWRGTWGGQKGWWMGGVKMHESVNQTVRNHTSIGNLTGGFWYDVQCEHVRIDGLTSVLNDGDGLFIELSNGPFEIARLLAAGNSGHAFDMSIVGRFSLRDSVLYANRSGTMKLKDKDVPLPLAHFVWYQRNDEHATLKKFDPSLFRIENTVFAGGPQQRGVIVEHNGLLRDDPRYAAYRYEGENNLFFLPGGAGAFAYVDPNWQPLQTDLTSWQARTTERNPQLADPQFTNAAQFDFRLRPGSPLAARSKELPLKHIDPKLIAETQRFKTWAETGIAPATE